MDFTLWADPTIANPFPGIASAFQGHSLTKSPPIQIIILIKCTTRGCAIVSPNGSSGG